TYPVCKYGQNRSALCDMTGNVMEMCEDIYSNNAYSIHQKNNPIYNGEGTKIVLRGSDFSFPKNFSPCRHRSFTHKDNKSGNIGFRLVWKR
ncbi:Sulphatase-modifying factor domain protein, partial [Candidatus Magnetomorum sp. HK-1]